MIKIEIITKYKLKNFITENEIEAACILSGTGEVTRANIQFPNKQIGTRIYFL